MVLCPFCKKDSVDYKPPVRCLYKYIKGDDKGRICNRIIKTQIGKTIDRPMCGQHLSEILSKQKIKVKDLSTFLEDRSRSAAEEGSN